MEPAEASTHNSRRAGSVPGPRSGPRTRRAGSPSALPGYAELHCKTNFSFLEGASHAQELVERAAEMWRPFLDRKVATLAVIGSPAFYGSED